MRLRPRLFFAQPFDIQGCNSKWTRLRFPLFLLMVLGTPCLLFGQATYTWRTTAINGTWTDSSNWLKNGQNTSDGVFPGNPNGSGAGAGGANTDVAAFGTLSTDFNGSLGIDMGGTGGLTLGSIDFNSTTKDLTISNSSSSSGSVQLGGSTINSVNNTLIAVRGSKDLTYTNGSSSAMELRLGITNGVFQVATDRTLTVGSSITQENSNSGFTVQGGGTMVLTGTNTYTGATNVNAGTLLVNGDHSGATGAITVRSGALLGGVDGILGGATTVESGGTIRGGSSNSSLGTLKVGNTTINAGGNLLANLNLTSGGTATGGTATNSSLDVRSNALNFVTNSKLKLTQGTFEYSEGGPTATFILASLANGDNLLVDGKGTTADQVLGSYRHSENPTRSGPVFIDASGLNLLNTGDRLTLKRQGNDLVLVLSPVPEPASLLAVCGLAAGGLALVRRRLRRKQTAADHITPA